MGGLLPLNLQLPTPAKLKDECLAIIAIRFTSKDRETLNQFFGHSDSNFEREIRRTETDKFRPLVNFLKGNTQETEDRNIELLAWLIDFNARPYVFGSNYKDDECTGGVIIEDDIELKEMQDELKKSPEGKAIKNHHLEEESQNIKDTYSKERKVLNKSSKNRYVIFSFAFIGIAILVIGTYIGLNLIRNPFDNKNYMYWAKDHFESIDNNKVVLNTQVIKLDDFKLHNFRKITRLDTLKEDCIGKIWYSKINNEIEFFTTSGMHPEHPERSLKLVTKHIFDKYIAKKASAGNYVRETAP
jgi:hypothetical protein